MQRNDVIEWDKFNGLLDDVQSMTCKVEHQTKQTLNVLEKTKGVSIEDFSKALDEYNLGVMSALKGIEYMQESSEHLKTAYNLLYEIEKKGE